eukprot:CAMPEP_0184855908 /NCGR_PEP_ID=MMETSP0580-20130426/1082_1 /TAXON_ID=1118495 /ORGANISM="Dactyliosolen fragilissimus" /LENGTH=446 /DNA_ID=CAMNT_0027350605 /DNA_START=41 /DNA_END=1378 /DNA_ORIENTATION=-
MDVTGNQLPFSFPLLKNQDIIQCLSEAGIELSLGELTEPNRHKERVKTVFTQLVQLNFGFGDKDIFADPIPKSMKTKVSTLPYPELHNDSLSDLRFWKACSHLMTICGLGNDFGWKDIYAPTPKRLRRQLSGAINFMKFREDRLQMYAELHEQRDELLEGLVEVNGERATLIKGLEQAEKEAEERWAEVETIEADCSELEKEIAGQNKLQASIRQESTELKKKAHAIKGKIATCELALQEKETEERKLLPQLVGDEATQIRVQLTDVQKSLEAEHAGRQEAQREMRSLQKRIENVDRAEKDVVSATEILEDITNHRNKLMCVEEEAESLRQIIHKNDDKKEKLRISCDNHKLEISQIEKDIENQRKKSKAELESVRLMIDNANEELLLVEQDRRENTSRVDAYQNEIRLLEKSIHEETDEIKAEIEEVIAAFKQMEKVVMQREKQF